VTLKGGGASVAQAGTTPIRPESVLARVSETLSETDVDKPVIDANGEQLATVERLEANAPLVDPEPEISPATERALGWSDGGERHGVGESGLVPLREQAVDHVTEAAVYLESNL